MSVNKSINKNLTIPNLLSVIRIVIVPFFAYYFIKGQTYPAIALLILSGISDCLDGFIARKFNQITEIGKILDPFADKITQVTVALCLAIRFPAICPFLILFLVKELSMLVCGIYLIGHKKRAGCFVLVRKSSNGHVLYFCRSDFLNGDNRSTRTHIQCGI